MKKLLMLLLVLALSAALLVSCKDKTGDQNQNNNDGNGNDGGATVGCTEHTDANGDFICDECEEIISETATEVTVTFTLTDDSGLKVAGINLILTNSENEEYNVTTDKSDANGKITAKLYTGTYSVMYDYDSDEIGFYLGLTSEIEVAEDKTDFTLSLQNNTPDGSVEKPFTVNEESNTFTIAPGAEFNFLVYHAVNVYVHIEGNFAKVTYREEIYTSSNDGIIDFDLLGDDTNSAEGFVLKNQGSSEITYTISIMSKPGTFGNPIVLDTLGQTITTPEIVEKGDYYYLYTANESGTVSITMISENTAISIMNNSTYQSVNTDNDAEDGVITISVSRGDTIRITCSSKVDEANAVSFIASFEALAINPDNSGIEGPKVDITPDD